MSTSHARYEVAISSHAVSIFLASARLAEPVEVQRDTFGGAHAHIVVRDPLWPKDEAVGITPECVSLRELEEQVSRIKRELDSIVRSGKRQFDEAKRDVALKAKSPNLD
ncbi:MAG: hypothetical protein H7Z74_14040 [Anaerolineae bacterium]|nr:hypothetical protein [Gemmatimonadaceae bacterium]